ncbi:hypothetical protein LTR56_021752 [Elasticomyces elasticus]|nr:hypothetical protein LTR56_021752 [Elasticomyces elasticus]KAK3630690.1 hypothetical protein LTR22_021385 [Elasticomyces elasticus]KAK4909110.1 hypothetical protein LTR49_022081 [Elasticomyces elasticus]KAK5749249.1 hypothetical protein LTS12_020691 [Elasticomyces elasticus]
MPPATDKQHSELYEADLSEALQYEQSPTADITYYDHTTPNISTAFSFPTLSPDGSLEDLRQSPRRFPPTPPAALSSLGAARSMAETTNMSESTSSFADSQYDMVDDLSEISSEDHDTASLGSTDHIDDDIATDEEENFGERAAQLEADQGLELDAQHDEDEDELVQSLTESEADVDQAVDGQSQSESFGEEGHTVESFLSEDLETPRQSTVPRFLKGTRRAIPRLTVGGSSADSPLRILLVADRGLSEVEKDRVCAKITTAMAGSSDTSECRITTLPLTPTGISPSSAITYHHGKVQVEFLHCIAAEDITKSVGNQAYTIHLLDADGEHSSVYRVGGGSKLDLQKPSLVVIDSKDDSAWLPTARSALSTLNVPILEADCVDANNGGTGFDELLIMDYGALRVQLQDLLHQAIPTDGVAIDSELTTSPAPSSKAPVAKAPVAKAPVAKAPVASAQLARFLLLIFMSLLALSVPLFQVFSAFTSNAVTEHAYRKEVLSMALSRLSNSTEATKAFSMDHILPTPTATATDMFGRVLYSKPSQVHYAPLQPNHIIVSIPKESGYWMSLTIRSVRAHKGTRDIAFNQTRIIDGVYDVAIDPSEAYGMVDIDGVMASPVSAFTVQHNFGNRLLQRQTYEKVGTGITNTITKDLVLASGTARSFSERLQTELIAGAVATKNVTTQIAIQMTRDLQVFVNAAASVAIKGHRALNQTVHAAGKELALMSNEVVTFGRSVRKSITTSKKTAQALVPTKKIVTSPLKLSHERAVGFRHKLFGGKKEVNNTSSSMTKELSTRMQDFVKVIAPAKEWMKKSLPTNVTKAGPSQLSKNATIAKKSCPCAKKAGMKKGSTNTTCTKKSCKCRATHKETVKVKGGKIGKATKKAV